jgi:hypothetical protein
VDGPSGRRNLDERKVTTGYHRYKQDLDDLFSRGESSKLVEEVVSKAPAARGEEPSKKGSARGRRKTKKAPARQKLLRAIRAATSARQITGLVDELLAKWELPDDPEILTQALEHEDEEIQAESLERLSAWLDGHVPRHKGVLRSRVRRLSSRSDDERVRSLAREVNRKL